MNHTSLTLADRARPRNEAAQWVYYAALAVLMIGASYGWRLGAATVLLYLLEGAFGLPVFAGTPERGIGLAYMMGPTGGYLAGYLVAAAAVGFLAERGCDRSIVKMFGAMLVGSLLVYALGVAWLSTFTGFEKAVAVGALPFLYGDLLKTVLAALAVPSLWALFERR
jgi:biotin transport system substrate-specific component